MTGILKFLDGKKTYLTAIVMAIAGALLGLGMIDQETYNKVVIVGLPAALAFIRSSINK